MQAKGLHVEPLALFSAPGNPQNTTALLDTIAKLKQDVRLCQQEKNAAIEQLNCLVSLIKRSWTGDHNASLHLANIVGLPPPEFDYRASHLNNTPVPDRSTRAAMLWERLSIKLLDRYYAEIQEEIKEQQMIYMQNRQLYMEELLHHHQIDMAKTPIKKNSKTYEEVDRKFINAYSKVKPTGGMKQRIKSAPPRSRNTNDIVNGANLKMRDLFVSDNNRETQIPLTGSNSQMIVTNSAPHYVKDRIDYDDPQRYCQKNLFDLDTIFGPEGAKKKQQRPASAFVPRGQPTKSRPQSGKSAFITQKSERPMKYETTRPVSAKIAGKKTTNKLKSASEPAIGQRTFVSCLTQENHEGKNSEIEIDDSNNSVVKDGDSEQNEIWNGECESDEDIEEIIKPPMKVRVNSAPKRPEHIDRFVKDLQTMEDMERDFKKSAVQLQKKLGIDMNGMVM